MISLSPAELFDEAQAPRYLDCCSICITTIIIYTYLIRAVISFICVTASFSPSGMILLVKREKQPQPCQIHTSRVFKLKTGIDLTLKSTSKLMHYYITNLCEQIHNLGNT